jgi:outer membrane protein OmpA-like peptidoglycan-associated protein
VRYFLDAEFNGFGGDLVSLALVPEDAGLPPFYEAVDCAVPTPWVAEHVLPVLRTTPLSRAEVADRFAEYLIDDEYPLLVADWPEDIAHAARLLITGPGSMFASYYSGEKLSDDIGDCPNIPGWKGKAAESQIGSELESTGRARLDGVNFDFSSATIRPESKPLLDQVADLLKSKSGWSITLEGHTDNIGGAGFNKTLSEQRAAAVKAYLASRGVDAARLTAVGFGFDKPVASNDGEGGRSQNRRVEIVKR